MRSETSGVFKTSDVFSHYLKPNVGMMEMGNLLERISVHPNVCHGQPCIVGTRIMVYLILELLEAGVTPDQMVRDYYPQLTQQDIEGCLHYAVSLICDTEYVEVKQNVSLD